MWSVESGMRENPNKGRILILNGEAAWMSHACSALFTVAASVEITFVLATPLYCGRYLTKFSSAHLLTIG